MKKIILITIFCLALPALVFMFVGCLSNPGPNQDFGTPVTADALNTALDQAQVQAITPTISQMKKNEVVYTETTNQVETLVPVTVELLRRTITSQTADDNKINFVITQEIHQLNPDTGNMDVLPPTQKTLCLPLVDNGCEKATPPAPAPAPAPQPAPAPTPDPNQPPNHGLSTPIQILSMGANQLFAGFRTGRDAVPVAPNFGAASPRFKSLSVQALQEQLADQQIQYTYHNLVVTPTVVPLPALVNLRADCGGRHNPCPQPLKGVQVTWDQVDWTTEQHPVKYSFSLVFSSEVPVSSALISSCFTTTVPYQSQRISVSRCENVKDFTFGK